MKRNPTSDDEEDLHNETCSSCLKVSIHCVAPPCGSLCCTLTHAHTCWAHRTPHLYITSVHHTCTSTHTHTRARTFILAVPSRTEHAAWPSDTNCLCHAAPLHVQRQPHCCNAHSRCSRINQITCAPKTCVIKFTNCVLATGWRIAVLLRVHVGVASQMPAAAAQGYVMRHPMALA